MTILFRIYDAISSIIPSLAHNKGILMGSYQMPLASALSSFLPFFVSAFLSL
jgi:hypothetical protein